MITIKDIAAELGISPSTVSRALNNHPAINYKTKKLVLECATKHNYIPNRNARNLVNQNSYTIGFMIPDISDSFFSHTAYGVEEVLYHSGHDIVYCSTERKPERIVDFLVRAREYCYSGVFLTPDCWDQQLVDRVQAMGLPVLSLRRKTPVDGYHIPYVDSDHFGGAYQAITYLVQLGHTQIGMVSLNTMIERERQQGYRQALLQHQLAAHLVYGAHTNLSYERIASGRQATAELLHQNPHITAIFASDDMLAIGALEHLASVGLKVPQDISVIGCDDRPESSLFPIQLTTVQQSLHELGQQAAHAMLHMIHDKDFLVPSIQLPTKLVERKTTGKKRDRS